MVIGLKTMYRAMCIGKGDLYRAEVGRAGDGARPSKARDTGRGMRSRVEVYRHPPDGAKRRRGALAELNRRFKGCKCDGVGTRRVETPRGKGAKRLAGPKLRIDRGGMGGGGSVDHVNPLNYDSDDGDPNFEDDYYNNPTRFSTERKGIFHYCVFCDECYADGDTDREGRGAIKGNHFVVCNGRLDDPIPVDQAHTFIYELCKRNILGRSCPYGETKCACSDDPDESFIGLCNGCWADIQTVSLVR